MLPTRVGVMMSRCSDSSPVQSLMVRPLGSSRGWFLQQVEGGHSSPLWGLDHHQTKRSQSRVVAQYDWFAGWEAVGVG